MYLQTATTMHFSCIYTWYFYLFVTSQRGGNNMYRWRSFTYKATYFFIVSAFEKLNGVLLYCTNFWFSCCAKFKLTISLFFVVSLQKFEYFQHRRILSFWRNTTSDHNLSISLAFGTLLSIILLYCVLFSLLC